MKDLLKYGGALLLLIGTAVLCLSVYQQSETNTLLIVSALLIILGLLGFIFTNKVVE